MRRLAAVGAAIGLLTAACGGGGGGNSATVTLVRDAPKRTTDAHTAGMAVTIEQLATMTAASHPPPPAPIAITGQADFAAHRGQMTIDLTQYGLPQPVDAVFDNATVYEKFPAVTALPGGKTWVKVDLATAGKSVGVGAAGVGAAQASDPSQTLDYLLGASSVTRVGAENVRDTPTTHYRAVVDLNKAAAQSPTAKQAIESTAKLLGSSNQPVEVWLDAQGRVRRMKYTVDLSKSKATTSTSGLGGSVRFTLELFDFGVPVQATIPPADQVVDFSQLSGGK
ncbi:MAG: hypothetical protein JO148_11525 [Acidimicrobiia bacterium]|nr:hypothetical protein [Acidimicrobiia bacterium]